VWICPEKYCNWVVLQKYGPKCTAIPRAIRKTKYCKLNFAINIKCWNNCNTAVLTSLPYSLFRCWSITRLAFNKSQLNRNLSRSWININFSKHAPASCPIYSDTLSSNASCRWQQLLHQYYVSIVLRVDFSPGFNEKRGWYNRISITQSRSLYRLAESWKRAHKTANADLALPGCHLHVKGAPIKIPWEKFCISAIVADFFSKFTVYRGEFRPQMKQISLQYLVWFNNYNCLNLKAHFSEWTSN